jgi:transcriptional regulator with XRE-family HTH domain
MHLAKTITRLRLARGLTQTALAKKIGVSQAFIAQLKTGAETTRRSIP